VVAFPIGVLAAWLVLRTGSIIPGIVLHAALNFTSAFLIVPIGSLLGHAEEEIYAWEHLPWPVLLAGAFASIVGLMWLWFCARRVQRQSETDAMPPADPA
jgi:hypothetical protein